MGIDIEYPDFISWLGAQLLCLPVHLVIPKSARNSTPIDSKVKGLEQVLRLYSWNTAWIDNNGHRIESQNWCSTKNSVARLRNNIILISKRENSTDQEILNSCKSILKWGGNRNYENGAYRFLTGLAEKRQLKSYLLSTKQYFLLCQNSKPDLSKIKMMNSMLTKIHAFLSEDGLPIYDSRVAVTAACLVEMYRREKSFNHSVSEKLSFPEVGGQGDKRSVRRLFRDFQGSKVLRYGHKNLTSEWSKAKWHLGRTIRDVLASQPSLFSDEGNDAARAHAVEAAFFMIGYDVCCLSQQP